SVKKLQKSLNCLMVSNSTCDKSSHDNLNVIKESEGITKQINSLELSNENDSQIQCSNNSIMVNGNGYSTPVDDTSLQLRDSMGISVIEDQLSAKSSPAPSGFTEMDVFMGNSWLNSDSSKNHMSKENLSEMTDEKATSDRIFEHNNMVPELNDKNWTDDIVEPGECVAGYESRILGDEISTVGCESSSIEKTNREDADLKISECNVINNDQQNLVCVDPEKNQDESSRANFTGTNSTNNRDSDYVPSREITLNNSHLSSDDSLVKLNKKAFIDSHLSKGPPMDGRNLHISPSKTNGVITTKKHFCQFCETMQTKYARHILKAHSDNVEVQKCLSFPVLSNERKREIAKLRKRGDFIHNTHANLNTGVLITCRRPRNDSKKNADEYVTCSNCLGSYSKSTLRIHFAKCDSAHKKGQRGQLMEGKGLSGYIHHRANAVMQRLIFPAFQDDAISSTIRYDELLILYGNKLCDKYTLEHQSAMIRSHLRLLARFKIEIKKINKKVTDLASVFRAKRFESLVQAVKVCANYDETKKIYKTPANATTLGIQLKKCCGILKSDYAKKEYVEGLNRVEGFLNVFNDEFNVAVTRKALEDQTTIRRNKKIVLPSQEDISKLYTYLKERCENAMVVLNEKFDVSAWTQLSESVLILLIMFNRRRPGESERFLLENYRNQEKIDDALNLDMYSKVSKESQKQANQFVRIVCRGKLGRTVAVLMHKFLLTYIDKILEYRKEARVSSSNPYLFAVPGDKYLKRRYFRACVLLNRFAKESGAKVPQSLRCTMLRKHIATYTAMLGLQDNKVKDLANFMGHHENIHKDVYVIPNCVKDMVEVSRLLQAAVGGADQESVEDYDSNNASDSNDDNDDDNENNGDSASEKNDKQNRKRKHSQERQTYKKSKHEVPQLCSQESREAQLVTSDDNDDLVSNTFTSKRRTPVIAERERANNEKDDYERSQIEISQNDSFIRRTRWSIVEKSIIQKEFGDLEKMGKLPSIARCQRVIDKNPVLKNRTAAQMKTFIDNQRRAQSRKQSRLREKNINDY
ncbi:hypothetical protein PV326_011490, partial [Microctonus aethiopoides]